MLNVLCQKVLTAGSSKMRAQEDAAPGTSLRPQTPRDKIKRPPSSWPIDRLSRRSLQMALTLVAAATLIQVAHAYEFVVQKPQPAYQNQQHAQQMHHLTLQPLQQIQFAEAPNGQTPRRPADESDTSSSSNGEADSEAQQLRQLHQVVDTVAHLLNEEEAQRSRRQPDSDAARQQSEPQPQLAALQSADSGDELQPAASELTQSQHLQLVGDEHAPPAPQTGQLQAELMSESSIRQAIEELERVQQQERQRHEAADRASREQPVGGQLASNKRPTDNNANNFDSLIDELGDEFLGAHLAAASRETQRLVQQRDQQLVHPQQQQVVSDASVVSAPSSTTQQQQQVAISEPTKTQSDESPAAQPAETLSASASSQPNSYSQSESDSEQQRPAALVMGQLDSSDSAPLSSDLNSALTNDFYNFHAESLGAQSAAPPSGGASPDQHEHLVSSSSSSSSSSQQDQAEQVHESQSSSAAGGEQRRAEDKDAAGSAQQKDLDSAAQTRSAQQQQHFIRQPFDESQSSSLNLDFSQPPQASRPSSNNGLPSPIDPQLVRAFRPQPQQAPQASQFAPSSTNSPFSPADNFWRPSAQSIGQLGEQYERATGSLPPLPATRFQSLTSPAPFEQAPPHHQHQHQDARNQHTHFTGHSFVHSNEPFGTQSRNQQPFVSSTQQPIISVLGTDAAGSNSVSWNPPAAPPQPAGAANFGQVGPFSTLAPHFAAPNSGFFRDSLANSQAAQMAAQKFSGPQHSQPTNSFRPQQQQFQAPPRDNSINFSPIEQGSNNERGPQPTALSMPSSSTTTEASVAQTTPHATPSGAPPSRKPNQQWSPFMSSLAPFQTSSPVPRAPGEREAADSQPRSTIRSFQPGASSSRQAQFFSSNEASGNNSPFSFTTLPSAFSSVASASAASERQPRQRDFISGQPASSSFSPISGPPEFGPVSTPFSTTSRNQLIGAGAGGSGSESTTPASLDAPVGGGNSTNKKDDMVIYYYYYYDDNKNATVVAKNISASAADHINGANLASDPNNLEMDGGLEDTPYMDDPVPSSAPPNVPANMRPTPATNGFLSSSQRPFSSSTTSTISSSTTTPVSSTTGSAVSPNSFEPPTERLRNGGSAGLASNSNQRFAAATNERQPNINKAELNESVEEEEGELDQFQNDQQRPPAQAEPKPGRPGVQQLVGASLQPPSMPTATSRPANQRTPQDFSARPSSNQQLPSRSGQPSRQFEEPAPQRQLPPQPGARLIQQQQPASPTNRATSLSNASRYGTSTNNQFLEPFGIDPAAPVAVGPNRESGMDSNGLHHGRSNNHALPHNQQPPAARQPVSVDSILAATGAHLASGLEAPARLAQPSSGQNFSPQRQTAPVGQPTRKPATVQQAAPRQQFFPESQPERPAPQPARLPTQAPPQRQQPLVVQATRAQQPSVSSTQQPNADANDSIGLEPADQMPPDDQERQPARDFARPAQNQAPARRPASSAAANQNGRPISSEGNTGNGFTRAPPVVSSSPSSSSSAQFQESSTFASVGQRLPSSLAPRQATVSSTASSVGELPSSSFAPTSSRTFSPFVNQPAPAVSTGASMLQEQTKPARQEEHSSSFAADSQPPSEPIATTLISRGQAQPQTTPTSTTTTTTSTTTTTTTTTQAPDTAATESGTANSASTRKKFGNRFQTRLSAIRTTPSSSSTTSTTQAPQVTSSSSTTRRPLASTTRKSSKQLFADRRKKAGSSTAAPEAYNANLASSTLSPPPADSQASSTSPSSSTNGVQASRARFGNSFTGARSRPTSTTSGPFGAAPESTTARPGQLPAQRATARARLPFLRGAASSTSKPTTLNAATESLLPGAESSGGPERATATVIVSTSSSVSEASSSDNSNNNSANSANAPATTTTSETGAQAAADLSPSSAGVAADSTDQSEPAGQQPSGSAAAAATEPLVSSQPQASSTTSAPAIQTTTSKPKRPLFASRQRSSSLFGNRRSNSAA